MCQILFLFQFSTAKPAVTKKGADLFNDDQEENELFSSKPKTTKPMAPKPMAPAAKAKPSSDLFGDSTEDDLFSAPAKPPSIGMGLLTL